MWDLRGESKPPRYLDQGKGTPENNKKTCWQSCKLFSHFSVNDPIKTLKIVMRTLA